MKVCLYSLFYAAHKFELTKLREIVGKKLLNRLNEKNALKIYEYVKQFEQSILLDHIIEYVQENTFKIIRDKSFGLIQRSTLRFLLEQQNLNVKEPELFQACLRWAKVKTVCARNSANSTSKLLRKILASELYLLRLPTMTQQEFMSGPAVSKIFEPNEIADFISFQFKKEKLQSEFILKFCLDKRQMAIKKTK